MDFKEAIEQEIARLQAKQEESGPSDFDAWDKAEIAYLEGIRDGLADGVTPQAAYEKLKTELPRLEEEVAREESCYTFDWYDDHYYEKIYSGQLAACRTALKFCENALGL